VLSEPAVPPSRLIYQNFEYERWQAEQPRLSPGKQSNLQFDPEPDLAALFASLSARPQGGLANHGASLPAHAFVTPHPHPHNSAPSSMIPKAIAAYTAIPSMDRDIARFFSPEEQRQPNPGAYQAAGLAGGVIWLPKLQSAPIFYTRSEQAENWEPGHGSEQTNPTSQGNVGSHVGVLEPRNGAGQNYESLPVLTGRLKFFDDTRNYGFFTLDHNGRDLFVHYDDLLNCGFTKEDIARARAVHTRFAFRCIAYYGKYNLSHKAVDIRVLDPHSHAYFVQTPLSSSLH
jgi:hypothetical protein